MNFNQAAPCCPDCGGAATLIGAIPATEGFAGRILQKPLQGGFLYRCSDCHLGFRWPRLSKNELDRLYAEGKDDTWSSSGDGRRDWRIARRWLAEALPAGARILDVGCFDGGFLEPFTQSYQCFGIEIHPEARKRAEGKGVSIQGADFSELQGQYDCITAFDVIEHVESPRRFLEQGLSCLARGGRFLISTGNLDSFSFRLMGSRYCYCTLAEHIAFISPAWVKHQAADHGLQIEFTAFFTHADYSLLQAAKYTAANLIYRLWPGLMRRLRLMGWGGKDVRRFPELADHPPPWSGARDHFLVVLRKP